MRTSHRQAFILALSLTACLLALTAPHSARASAYNYITNGGFESGVDAWSMSSQVQFDTVDSSAMVPHEGDHSGKITLSGSVPVALRQSMAVASPPGSYHFSAWVMRISPSTEIVAEVDEGPTTPFLHFSSSEPVGQWTQIEGHFDIVHSAYFTIMFGGAGTAGDTIYVDDVRLDGAAPVSVTPTATATAEPTTAPQPAATSTRTLAATKTVAPTKTPRPTATPNAAAVALIGGGLTNAGFESTSEGGLPTAWQKYGGVLRGVDTHVRSGGRAAQLESTSTSTKWLFQSVLVDGGGSYEFGAWIADDDSGVAAAFLRVSWYASDDASGSALDAADSTERLVSPALEYRHLTTGSITAPADAHSARLRIMLAPVSAAPAAIFVDDASFGAADPVDEAVAPADGAPAAAASADGGASSEDDGAPPVHRVLGKSTSPRPAPSGSAAHIVINEVMYDPDGAADPAGAEWLELYNAGDTPVSIAAWSLSDAASTDTLPAGVIEPHGYAIVAASDSFRTNNPGFTGAIVVLTGRIGNSLGNNGDRLILRDASGATADAISWGTDTSLLKPAIVDVPSGHSIERRTAGADRDLASDFVDNMHPSPGGPFVPNSAQLANIQSMNQPEALPSGQRSLDWLIWAVSGLSATALAVMVALRVAPSLSQRIRRQA